ncbi:hypothetical protein D3C86_1355770 [compost metagenome]
MNNNCWLLPFQNCWLRLIELNLLFLLHRSSISLLIMHNFIFSFDLFKRINFFHIRRYHIRFHVRIFNCYIIFFFNNFYRSNWLFFFLLWTSLKQIRRWRKVIIKRYFLFIFLIMYYFWRSRFIFPSQFLIFIKKILRL